MKRRRVSFERRIHLLALGAGLPGSAVALVLLWTGDAPARTQWTWTLFILIFWVGFASAVREKVVFPLRTFSNLLAALREGDYSFRMRAEDPDDALGEVMLQVNAMAETLRHQRLSALEATALLRTVMAEIDVAVFAFDGARKLLLVNRAGERLLARASERLIDLSAEELGLGEYLEGTQSGVIRATFPGGSGLWGTRRTEFRQGGMPHTLLVISNLTRPLREEELAAWQRLVRVLGHEINNSLAPVKSISGSLADLLAREPLPGDWREDARSGLQAIASRSEALSRFTGAYTRLARLPSPEFGQVNVPEWIRRVVRLETRLTAAVEEGPDLTIRGDRDQLEQLLINVLKNAVDAVLENRVRQIEASDTQPVENNGQGSLPRGGDFTGASSASGGVRISWAASPGFLDVWVEDDGPGLANAANLFVPFFTTKLQGSGIGLVLSRQIAEAHGGELILSNREGRTGCKAYLRIPR